MQLSPKNYSHGNKPHFTKGYFPPKIILGWNFSISGCDGQMHSFVRSFTPRRFQVGLSSCVLWCLWGSCQGLLGKHSAFFIPILTKKPQPFMQKFNLQSKEEKSIIIEIPFKSKIRVFLWAVNILSSTRNSLVLNISQEDVSVLLLWLLCWYSHRVFFCSLVNMFKKEQFFLKPRLEKRF